VTPQPVSSYAREVRTALPAHAFATVPSRLLWLLLHVGLIVAGTVALAERVGGWWAAPLWAVLIGHSFAGCAFVGHETLHGAVVRKRWLRYAVGWIGFLPFVISPRFWVAWHNKVHHGHTGQTGIDPDAYPTLAEYRDSLLVRVVTDHLSLGRQRWGGALSLVLGFSIQSAQVLAQAGTRARMSRRQHRLAIGETALGIALWTTLALLIGGGAFLFAFVLPLVVANVLVMSFILTNHSLSSLTEVNDPLVNSLSVTVPRLFDFTTLRFGFHVEHPLFPAMNSRHAPLLRRLILARWPERYQSMPLWRAVWQLMRTARVYKQATLLVDPKNGQEWPALEPRSSSVPIAGARFAGRGLTPPQGSARPAVSRQGAAAVPPHFVLPAATPAGS